MFVYVMIFSTMRPSWNIEIDVMRRTQCGLFCRHSFCVSPATAEMMSNGGLKTRYKF